MTKLVDSFFGVNFLMASSSGNSSMSTRFQSSGSEEDLQLLMDQRKRKRKQSNRESARKSRMRKQKYLDDLIAEVERLTRENNEILTRVNITTEHYLKVEAHNCILRAQIGELSQGLHSLNDILSQINNTTSTIGTNSVFYEADYCYLASADHNFLNHHMNMNMNMLYLNQPIMASADHMVQWRII